MENKNGSAIFLGVIGVATLIVAIIGATFAFFSASATTNNDAISVASTQLALNFNGDTYSNLKTHLIPAAENIATYAALDQTGTGSAANQQCVDDNANEVCGVYAFTVTNPSTTTQQDITVTLNVTTNTFATLKYKVYEGLPSDLTHSSTAKIAKTAFGASGSNVTLALGTSGNTVTLAPQAHADYTIVIWIDETNTNQTSGDSGQSFAAGLTVTSGSGNGVTGVISAAGTNG